MLDIENRQTRFKKQNYKYSDLLKQDFTNKFNFLKNSLKPSSKVTFKIDL